MARSYQHLSQEERDSLFVLKAEGMSLRDIAKRLDRSPSTLSRELIRNSPPIIKGRYLPHVAQQRAQQRRLEEHRRVRMKDPRLRGYIRRQMMLGWSPERIAGRWKVLGHGRISHEAIYQWVYSSAPELISHLHRARKKRLRRGHRSNAPGIRIPSRKSVRERPKVVAGRKQAGHWEADTMIGKGCKSTLQILVERKTRLTRLNVLPHKSAPAMRRTLNKALSQYPKGLRRTITYDNGSENYQHLAVNKVLGTKSYFCAPMHSWEKGTVENTAGLVRRRLPRQTDFGIVPKSQIKRTEHWLNHLPRKCLGFKTPAEVFRLVLH